MLDHSGFPLVEGGICTTLRDLARFGLLCLEDGAHSAAADRAGRLDRARAGARRRADRGVPRLATPPTRSTPDAFYHDKWWVHDGPRGIYAALGMNGQSILIHRPARIVIAKFSTFPDALDDELFALDHAGVLALCEYLA